MGYLLKEALKTLCGVNQWSYAVYWKIGCQNPKLLIWEDCYCEPTSCSGILGDGTPQTLDNLHFLVNKMMVDSQINIVGQGLVGRVAFTGNHQWLLSDNIFKETCPPEVLKEVFQQFSAGMQTVAVIPVLPHGVVQFASYNTIMENMGFVQHVKSLVCQLGHVPGVLLSQNYAAKELDPKTEVPECFGNPTPGDFYLQSNFINDSYMFDNRLNYSSSPAQSSVFECQTSHSLTKGIQNDLTSIIAAFQASNSSPSYLKPQDYSQNSKINSAVKLDFPPQNQIMNGVAKAEVISPNTGMQMNQLSSQFIPRSNQDLSSCSSSMLNHDHFSNPNVSAGAIMPEPKTNSGVTYSSKDGYVTFPSFEASGLCQGVSSIMEPSSGTICTPVVKRAAVENISAVNPYKLKNVDFGEGDNKKKNGGQIHMPNTTRCDDALVQPQSGDDLFDILGANFKNNLFSTSWNSSLSSESAPNVHNWDKNNSPCKAPTEVYTESTIFTMPADTDHLLDVVVSKVHHSGKQSLNDNVSCKTTLTNISSSSTGITSLPYGRFGVSDKLRGELLGIPKYQATSQAVSSGPFKEDSVTYSQGSTIYGSQVSSLFGKGQNVRQSNSVPTEYSKKPDETAKTNRKRSKPGENPRPRPKDRQMIQDRVKELREIVPNGGKCSIDALLERTIKHMLFLQSVTKHADKLKQTEESKIISKDGGLLMKDNFEGGATWAYEVGSQSMVCPIIVEDLNQPRQMLVEILCEERGLFLEIADIIRGMGLTILKGVMETRNDKIWARFSVEANRDVTRMEIFLSLVRLLEQTAKNCASQSSENTVLQQLHQAPSVPTSYDQ